MEEEPGENLVGNQIGEEINCSGFFFNANLYIFLDLWV